MAFTISSRFINDYSLGDNINHNLQILDLLYKYYSTAESWQKNLLRKPITILIIAIIEAVLYDFYTRIKNNVREGIENLDESAIKDIRGKKISKFEKYIDIAKEHNFFDLEDDKFYNFLKKKLCKIRNRVHLQNVHSDLEKHERDVFTETRMIMAERSLELILKKMVKKYSRAENKKFVDDFVIPWSEYFVD